MKPFSSRLRPFLRLSSASWSRLLSVVMAGQMVISELARFVLTDQPSPFLMVRTGRNG
ncbi:hypothetical protein SynBMKMC1_02134 [Synechococcus sp. BMK-MC-1]|nr:hypothetical protein SynBMKMC1_02134 [Synechococcus sp. BMK-MC-1]